MSDLAATVRGRVWKVGDSVDTNQLAGGGLDGGSRERTLRINCMRAQRPDFTKAVQPGDILVAGQNFGCGSSRQSAVEALQLCGIAAVLAESVARIHRRNSIALALPTFVVPGIIAFVDDGQRIELDYPAGVCRNLCRGTEVSLPRFAPSVEAIYAAGGVMEIIGQRLRAAGFAPDAT